MRAAYLRSLRERAEENAGIEDRLVAVTGDDLLHLIKRAEMFEVALQMLDNLLDHPINDIGRKNAQEIIRHALREATSQ